MLLAVLSDSHFTRTPGWFEGVYRQWLADADVLLHCGDHTSFEFWQRLCGHPRFLAVRGNCDSDARLASELPMTLRFELEGVTIGAAHGWGDRPGVPKRMAEAFGPQCDLVCYGHTHRRDWSVTGGVRLLNPGSFGDSPGSLARLTLVRGREPECEFIDLP